MSNKTGSAHKHAGGRNRTQCNLTDIVDFGHVLCLWIDNFPSHEQQTCGRSSDKGHVELKVSRQCKNSIKLENKRTPFSILFRKTELMLNLPLNSS